MNRRTVQPAPITGQAATERDVRVLGASDPHETRLTSGAVELLLLRSPVHMGLAYVAQLVKFPAAHAEHLAQLGEVKPDPATRRTLVKRDLVKLDLFERG